MRDRQCDLVTRHERYLRRLLCRDILRQFEMDRSRSLLPSDPEGFTHDRGDRRRAECATLVSGVMVATMSTT
jgi:hypothetical protein